MSWSFKLGYNGCWICGLVPIGKKDYRGSLCPGKFICLEEEKEAFVVTPGYESVSGSRHKVSTEREMAFYGKEIEVCFLNIFLFSLFSIFLDQFYFDFLNYFLCERFEFWENKKK